MATRRATSSGKVQAGQVQPLLESLAELALLRHVPELDAYAT